MKKADYHRPLIFNSVLWSLAFVILLFVFSKGKTPITVDYIYTIAFLLVMAIPVSINFYVKVIKYVFGRVIEAYVVLAQNFPIFFILVSCQNLFELLDEFELVLPCLCGQQDHCKNTFTECHSFLQLKCLFMLQ